MLTGALQFEMTSSHHLGPDGIVGTEDDEECDAGAVNGDACCTADCKLQSDAVCSDKNSWCCKGCQVVSKTNPTGIQLNVYKDHKETHTQTRANAPASAAPPPSVIYVFVLLTKCANDTHRIHPSNLMILFILFYK